MIIVIPMSGDGVRFRQAGYQTLKPFIEIDGMPMVEHAIRMFPGEKKIVLISRKDHLQNRRYRATLKRIAPSAEVVQLPQRQPGPVPAVLAASDLINDKEPVIVNYCDFSVYWDYQDFKQQFLVGNYDGAVTTYTGFHPHLLGPNVYAGVLTNDNNLMTAIKEKHSFTEDKMASRHSSGTYAFRSGATLKHYFKSIIDRKIMHGDEYYVSLVYQPMLEDGKRILVYDLEHFLQWGTPQDMEEYNYWSGYFAHKS